MSDGGILTPEQVEKSLTSPSLDERSLAETVKAACERLAQIEKCPECLKAEEAGQALGLSHCLSRCAKCHDGDLPGLAHRTWQDACRSLGGE